MLNLRTSPANMRIIEAIRQNLGEPEEKFPHNLEHYGNAFGFPSYFIR